MNEERIKKILTYCENLPDDERGRLLDELRRLSPIPELVEDLHRVDAPAEWPICNGCGAEIITVPGQKPFTVIVREPMGREHEGGIFCLGCMIELAKLGLQLHEL